MKHTPVLLQMMESREHTYVGYRAVGSVRKVFHELESRRGVVPRFGRYYR